MEGLHGLVILTNPEVGRAVEQRITKLVNRLTRAVGGDAPYMLHELAATGDMYRHALAGEQGVQAGEYVARIALEELVDDTERLQPEFWRTPFGRACAWWIGSSDPYVPRTVAAAVLGCSRQNVQEMVKRGTLAGTGEGVDAGSLRDALRRKVAG